MAVFKCKMCGGVIEFEPGASIGVCDSCGTRQTLPKLDNERRAQMYDRANHFRRNNEYDKAMGVYEDLLNDDPTDAEAYWSLVLCRYGIEYVEDPATRRQVPTVNRAQYTSIYADEDYKSALAHADGYQREIYEQEAAVIDEIQKGILEISSREEPFDVFICYKETDNNGRRTQDSVLANELYHELTQEGFKVFFARITLEDKLGSAYEPYIFAALHSAKVMVVLGTRPEYFNAVWVRNEWSRFLALVKQSDGKKTLIPAYRNMDAYDLPEEFSNLQAQDMSKLGFMQDLIRGIRKIIGSGSERGRAPQATVVVGAQGTVAPLLERVSMFLEDGAWADADTYCEKVLDLDPKNGRAYLGKLLAELKVAGMEQLQGVSYREYEHKPSYEKAIRFDAGIAQQFAELKEKALSAQYDRAAGRQETATSPDDYEGAAAMFAALGDYRDAPARVENCHEQAQALIQQAREQECSEAYDRAARQEAAANSAKNFRDAASLFSALGDYRDAQERAKNCKEQAHAKECVSIYCQAQDLMKRAKRAYDYLFAAQLFSRIRDWRDARELEIRCRTQAERLRKKTNRLVFITVAVSLALIIVIIAVSAGCYTKYVHSPAGYLSYREEDGGMLVTGVNSDRPEYVPGDIFIPAKLKGKVVTGIDDAAFSRCMSLTSVTFAKNSKLTRIGNEAFEGCENLIEITLPSSLTHIGYSAFEGASLTEIAIPEGVTHIGYGAFEGCESLTGITLPSSLVSIGEYAFDGCTSLKNATIPEGVTSICKETFRDCESLTAIVIPMGVTSIGDSAFSGCTGLTSVTIPSSVKSIGQKAFSGCTRIKTAIAPSVVISAIPKTSLKSIIINDIGAIGSSAFADYASLTSITIPEGVTSIGNYAFSGCTGLTSITIPSSVTSIGEGAFYGCTRLTNITIHEGVKSIGNMAFDGCTGLASITIPSSVTSIGSGAFSCCTRLTSITIPDGVTSIGTNAFYCCTSLTSITIPSSAISIGDYAFKDCTSLTSVTIPSSVTSIGDYAFSYCTNLTSITILDGLTSIGEYAFCGCTGLTSVTIPSSVTSIDSFAFLACTSLASITVEDGNAVYHSAGNCLIKTATKTLVAGCKNSVIPTDGSVTNIGDWALSGCTSLTSITIPSSVTSIGTGAFSYCTSLTSITVGDGNTVYHSAGNCIIKTATKTLVAGCKNSVIPTDGSVTCIGDLAFFGCRGLTSIAIPSSVTSIGSYAFYDCRILMSITIPERVTSIGSYAFNGCTSFTRITYTGTIARWNRVGKGSNWSDNTGDFVVHCTDGDITK